MGVTRRRAYTLTIHLGENPLPDPPLVGIGAWLVARLCGAHIFHWVQDVDPEIAAVLAGQR